jgi:glyoxylase-like metal-dependent hydrolase (beta-lactamase superfamily II)
MLKGAGGNLGVLAGKDGVFLIDSQFAELSDKIKAAIAKISPAPVRFVVNTHWHGDHTGGNENFEKSGSIIVAQDNVRVRMSTAQFDTMFNDTTLASPEDAWPVVTFTDAVTFHWDGQDVWVFHVPNAHTDGDAVIQFKQANVVHTGDVLFNGNYPFIDISTGGSVKGTIAAADRILKAVDDNTKIIPGHGPLANKKDLQAYRDMLADISGKVEAMLAKGKTPDQIKAAKPSAAYDAKWGNGFLKPDMFVDIMIKDLSS